MNKTKIEWCDSTWNPVTGCKHGCPYCYAHGIAKRFEGFEPRSGGETIPDGAGTRPGSIYNTTSGEPAHVFDKQPLKRTKNGVFQRAPYPYGFEPTLHRYRLGEPAAKTKAQTIFVCSMADLFGRWIPLDWIVEVLDACRRAPQHRYLFLTKNPKRYVELDQLALLPREDNFWYGSSMMTAETPVFYSNRHKTFVSAEPILEAFGECALENDACGIDWFIVGAETGNRAEKVVPEKSWIEPIVDFCKKYNKPLFMKNSMSAIWGEPLMTELAWEYSHGNK